MSVAFDKTTLETAAPVLTGDEMYQRGLDASLGLGADTINLIDAHKWFNLAAMHGSVEARQYRKDLSLEMTTDQIAEAQRRARKYLAENGRRMIG